VPVFPEAGPAACSGAVRQTVPGGCGPVVGQIWAGQRLVRAGFLGRPARRLRSAEPVSPDIVFAGHSAFHRIWPVLVGPAVSRWVQLWHGRPTDRIRPGSWRIRGPAVGPLPGRDAKCLLDGLAGDLTGAGDHQERQGECQARLQRCTPGIPRPRRAEPARRPATESKRDTRSQRYPISPERRILRGSATDSAWWGCAARK
jgi:hypothetical protein